MCLILDVQCELVTKPTDAVIIAKDSVIMKCSSNDVNDACENIMWKHNKPNLQNGKAINTKAQLTADFKSYISIVDTTAGNCNLMITATQLAAGTYKCVDKSDGDESMAELIIIGKPALFFYKYSVILDPTPLQLPAVSHAEKVVMLTTSVGYSIGRRQSLILTCLCSPI